MDSSKNNEDDNENLINSPISKETPVHRFLKAFDWREFACGFGAAFINISVTYPIYKMIFRQMLHGVRIQSAFRQMHNEGLLYLYRGVLPPLMQKAVSLSLMFGVYDASCRHLSLSYSCNHYLAKTIAGLCSGTAESIMLPFERIQTLLSDSKFHYHFKNTFHSFKYVYTKYGFRELYRGFTPTLLRNGPSDSLFFILREEAKHKLPKRETLTAQTTQEFLSGAFIGATLSAVFYPFNVIRVSMQSELGRKENIIFVTKKIFRERNYSIRRFYRGCWFNSSRSFLSWGIVNTSYEQLSKLIR